MAETTAQRLRRQALDMHACADRVLAGCDHECRCGHHPAACWSCSTIADTYRGIAADFHSRAIRAEQLEVS
jgi:hypothetical protein